MKKLITLDDGFFRELKQAFLPASLFQNDMQFIRSALAFALEQKKANGTSQQGTPQHGTPQHGTPQHGTPQHGTPQHGTPQQGTPQQGTPQHGTPQHGTPKRARLHDLAQLSKQEANAHRSI